MFGGITIVLFFIVLLMFSLTGEPVSIYLSEETVQGFSKNLTSVCNVTELYEQGVINTDVSCTRPSTIAWIGAYAAYSPWLDFIGCGSFNMSKFKPVRFNFTTEEDITTCAKKCFDQKFNNYSIIGLWNNTCSCFFAIDIVNQNETCNNFENCGERSIFFCENDDYKEVEEIRLSLYEKRSKTNDVNKEIGQCGTLIKNGTEIKYGSQTCFQNAFALCFDNSNKSNTAYIDSNKNWTETVKYCNRQSQIISSLKHFENYNKSLGMIDGVYWISSVRSVSFHTDDDTQPTGNFCVAANIENNKIILPFVHPCNEMLQVACIGENENNTKCTLTTATTNGDVTENVTKELDKNPETQTAIIIGIASGVGCVSLVIMVIVFCCIKKRKRTKHEVDTSCQKRSDEGQNRANLVYDEVPNSSDSNNQIRTGTDGIYDHTETIQTRNDDSTNYDTMASINQETEGLYETSGTNANSQREQDALYDHA